MARILADIPDEDIKWLDACAAQQGKSRASVLREAVRAYKAHSAAGGQRDWIKRGAGYWKNRAELGDAIQYQRALREDHAPLKGL
jgi:hypothetical protein